GGRHQRLSTRAGKLGNWAPGIGARYAAKAESIWQAGAEAEEARGSAVLLSAGGFVFNEEMMREWAGPFKDISPLGTVGDDGTGIRLGESAGGSIAQMHRMTAWRFMSPPSGLIEGVTVGLSGKRILNEDLYGATHSDRLAREFDGKGWLVLDSHQWKRAKSQVKEQSQSFQALQAMYLFTVGHKRAKTLDALAAKTGVDAEGLIATIDAYNSGIGSSTGDPAHKAPEVCTPVSEGPFYAIDISIKNAPFFPAPGLTLGGLQVDGDTGNVMTKDGAKIEGLYAAGRNAVGVCSNSYLSGLSLADGIFGGRRAGAHAASLRKR
ncbi:MAG TPA: FAD-binding protein, partial [Terrimesophilobacter sp.]|nr:FAD-binding protein [Terrimesophilobacter sp.]